MGEDINLEEATRSGLRGEYSAEEKEKEKEMEAAAIGYKVIGPLQKTDRVFEPYDIVFAVVQVYLI